ncbi:uncharacterized protein LOC113383738 isoform X2 [Ctenocephalides felis]|uniref:uncharacterized protein LOC113383738 isoform X2 n=1 Tax=Ctenocephalides felis TaxID=7515 RepID=UPI000E6E2CE2|nr:uncharacterized protein LOC113383738 isoform X2 [Ctenocephalides felis]
MKGLLLKDIPQNNNGNTGDESYQQQIDKSNLGNPTKANQNNQRNVHEPSSPPLYPPRPLDPIIRFLQEQHQLMLAGLHAEIESLKKKNTELQFQLVFSKNKTNAPCSIPSSPEDDSKSQISLSPKEINESPLQVELLEKELSETKLSLQHANTRSACLAALVDEQNKKIEALRATGSEEKDPDPDLQHALQESERLVRCLRRENDEQRRELASLRAAVAGQENANQNQACASNGRGQRGRNQPNARNNAGNNRNMGNHQSGRQGGHQYEQQRFPRLPTQNFWHQNGKMDENEKSDPNFQGALQEAERVVRCLQRENDDQRRELATLRAALAGQNQPGGSTQRSQRGKNPANPRNNSGNNRHQTGRQGGHQYEQQPRFPRLQSQSFWNQRGQDFGNSER